LLKIISLPKPLHLSQLKKNEKAIVIGFSNEEYPLKIIELGIIENTTICIKSRVPFNGPIIVEFGDNNAKIALRKNEADCILVKR